MHSVKITPSGVWINGERIERVLKAYVHASPVDGVEVELTIRADNVELEATSVKREEYHPQIEVTSLSDWTREEGGASDGRK